MEGWRGEWVEGWRGGIPSWLMLARSPVEEQLRPMGGGVEGRRGRGVESWMGGGMEVVEGVDTIVADAGALTLLKA